MNLTVINDFFYVVMNSDGKFFRKKGYGGYGDSWVDGLKRARVYVNISGARTVVTYFSGDDTYPIPKIIKLSVTAAEVIDEKDRIEKQKEERKKKKIKKDLDSKKYFLEKAKKDYEKSLEDYNKFQEKSNDS